MTLSAFAGGALMLAFTLGTAAYAARALTRSRLAWGVLASAILIAEHLIPLALGILNRGTVLATTALILIAGLTARSARPGRWSPRFGWWWLVPVLPAAGAIAYLGAHAGEPSFSVDTMSFQLPQVARWMQTGSLWQLDQFFPDYSNATYPSHGNVLLLAVTLPFDSTFLTRFVAVAFGAGACALVFAGARELGATPAMALLGAAVLAATPVLARTSLVGANTDPQFLFFLLATVVLLLRDRPEERWVAAVAAGLALGTKWYALTVLPPLALVWLVAYRPPIRVVVRLGTIALAVGGVWMLRNWILAGNPLFPQPLLGLNAPRDVYRETAGSSLFDYATDPSVWRDVLWPQFRDLFAGPGLLLVAAPLLALARTALRSFRSSPTALRSFRKAEAVERGSGGAEAMERGSARVELGGRATAVAVMAVAALAAYALTPYSALGPEGNPVAAASSMRYALPALALSAMAMATAPRFVVPVALLTVFQGVAATYEPRLPLTDVVLAALALTATIALIARAPRATAVALALAAVVGAAAIRAPTGYGAGEPALAWLEANAPGGKTIALAGDWSVPGLAPTLPAFGARLGNEVFYAGPFVDHMLRHERDPRRFAERIARADVLVVGRGFVPSGEPAPEETWARAAGFRPVAASDRLTVLVRQ